MWSHITVSHVLILSNLFFFFLQGEQLSPLFPPPRSPPSLYLWLLLCTLCCASIFIILTPTVKHKYTQLVTVFAGTCNFLMHKTFESWTFSFSIWASDDEQVIKLLFVFFIIFFIVIHFHRLVVIKLDVFVLFMFFLCVCVGGCVHFTTWKDLSAFLDT